MLTVQVHCVRLSGYSGYVSVLPAAVGSSCYRNSSRPSLGVVVSYRELIFHSPVLGTRRPALPASATSHGLMYQAEFNAELRQHVSQNISGSMVVQRLEAANAFTASVHLPDHCCERGYLYRCSKVGRNKK